MVAPGSLTPGPKGDSFPLSIMKRTHPLTAGNFLPVIFAVLCSVTAATSWAGLTWEKDRIDLKVEVGQEVARTSYLFTNTGSNPISVLAVKPSCGCVATNLEKLDYAPGERGEIKVTFDLEMDKDQSVQDRTIQVTTSDAPSSPKTLRLKVTVPEAVEVSPETLVWRHGKSPKPKEAIIKAGSGVEAISLTQTAQNGNFPVVIQAETKGKSYRLKITPKNTDSPCDATLNFDVKSPSFDHAVNCEIHLKID